MSIPDLLENINRKEEKGLKGKPECEEYKDKPEGKRSKRVFLFVGMASLFSFCSSVGLGLLWKRLNDPAPIIIQCSDEVLKDLQATSTIPIPPIKKTMSSKSGPKGEGEDEISGNTGTSSKQTENSTVSTPNSAQKTTKKTPKSQAKRVVKKNQKTS